MHSALELFQMSIGPASNHTVGPMRIAREFAHALKESNLFDSVAALQVELQSALALTGKGHAAGHAVILGLLGFDPEGIDPDQVESEVRSVHVGLAVNVVEC